MSTIELGAHLVAARFGYAHHGIYVGDGRVVHYSGLASSLSKGAIEETSIEDFAQDRDVAVRSYRNPKYVGEIAVQRARTRIGESSYDIHANNCEHFCSWVIMGCAISGQVDFVEDCLDLVLPRALIDGFRTRKHVVQQSPATEVLKDVAETTVLTVASTVVAGPIVLTYKLGKWLFGRNS